MGFRQVCDCDACGQEIDATDKLPAKVNVYPPTSREIGHQQDEHQLCDDCWGKLCAAFPKFKEAERFAQPPPPTPARVVLPSIMDTWPMEHRQKFVIELATAMGIGVKEVPDPPKPEPLKE